MTFIPSDSHSGFYFPPFAKANGPPFSPERETFRMLPLISFCILTLCKNRTFRFTPVICKDCTILSREWHNHSCGLMVCLKAGDWTLCTIIGYGLPERETGRILTFIQDITKRDLPCFRKVSFSFYPCADERNQSAPL